MIVKTLISNPKFHVKNVKTAIKCCHALSPYGTNTQQSIIRPLHFLDIKFSIFVASQSFNHRGNHEKSGLTQWSIAGVMLKRHWLQFQTFFQFFWFVYIDKVLTKSSRQPFCFKMPDMQSFCFCWSRNSPVFYAFFVCFHGPEWNWSVVILL